MTAMILLRSFQESQIEFWLPVKGFEGYDVSSFGRVRSYWRFVPGVGRTAWEIGPQYHVLKCSFIKKTGYVTVSIGRHSARGKKRCFLLHTWVAEAFLERPEDATEVNHKNGYKQDARLGNLEWATRQQNMQHALESGLRGVTIGEANFNTSITEAMARGIWELGRLGIEGSAIARYYKCSYSAAYNILKGKTWKHLKLGE
jgi:hypothetical protein